MRFHFLSGAFTSSLIENSQIKKNILNEKNNNNNNNKRDGSNSL